MEIQTGKYMIGLGRNARVAMAFGYSPLSLEDDAVNFFCLLDGVAASESELTLQVLVLTLAAEVLDDQCVACGRSYG